MYGGMPGLRPVAQTPTLDTRNPTPDTRHPIPEPRNARLITRHPKVTVRDKAGRHARTHARTHGCLNPTQGRRSDPRALDLKLNPKP
jgi:hypothetical protein